MLVGWWYWGDPAGLIAGGGGMHKRASSTADSGRVVGDRVRSTDSVRVVLLLEGVGWLLVEVED